MGIRAERPAYRRSAFGDGSNRYRSAHPFSRYPDRIIRWDHEYQILHQTVIRASDGVSI